jgi:hypothetical protein
MRLATGFNVSLDPSQICLAAPCAPGVVVLSNLRLRIVNPNNVQPEVDQWNLGVQRELPWNMVATAEYVGTKGTHLSILSNLNQQYFDAAGFPTGIIPYPNLGTLEYRNNVGNSTYHGLELSAQKRFSKGLSFTTAYTWSHSIDQAMEHLFGGGSNSFLQNAHDLTEQRGDSDFDYRQRFAFSYVYELPFGPGKALMTSGPVSHIIRGWRLSGGGQFHTGRPFTIFAGNNNSLIQNKGTLGNALADCPAGPVQGNLVDTGKTGPQWITASSFATPAGRLGTCKRNNERGPSYSNVDLGLARSFDYFGENRSLEFRWETFNLLNTPQFGLPTGNVNSGSFGLITSLAGDPRVMQFALKFAF